MLLQGVVKKKKPSMITKPRQTLIGGTTETIGSVWRSLVNINSLSNIPDRKRLLGKNLGGQASLNPQRVSNPLITPKSFVLCALAIGYSI